MKNRVKSVLSIMRTRPFCFFGAVFLCASFAASLFSGAVKWILAAVLAGLLIPALILLFLTRRRTAAGILLIFSGVIPALLLSCFGLDRADAGIPVPPAGESAECQMIVTDPVSRSAGWSRYEVLLTRIGGRDVRVRAILETPYDGFADIGDCISLPATIERTRGKSLSESYSFSNGFLLRLTAARDSSPVLLSVGNEVFPYTQSARLSRAVSLRVRSCVDGDSASLILSLLCGDKSGLSDAMRENITALGISHLFAVSGMHIGILITLIGTILQKLRLPRRARVVANLIIAGLYLAICAFAPSVCRAYGMFLILSVGTLTGRRRDPPTALFTAGVGLVTLFPRLILNVGFLLSFLSTLGILWMGLPACAALAGRFHGILLKILSALCLTLSAKIFTLPVTVLCFGSDSLISPVSALIFTGLVSLILILAPALLLFSLFQPLGTIFGRFAALPCKAVFRLASVGNARIFLLRFRQPALCLASAAVLAAVILILLFAKRKFRLSLTLYLSYIGCAVLLTVLLPFSAPRILAQNSGSNDALILTSGQHAILLDNSNGGYGFWSECLSAAGNYDLTVDTLLLTHYHNYQISGLSRLLDTGQIETLLLPGTGENPDGLNRLADLAASRKVTVVRYGGNGQIGWRDLKIGVFRETLGRSVHSCTAFAVSDGDGSALYLSASAGECPGLAAFLEPLPAPDRIWLGRHGPAPRSDVILPERFREAEILPFSQDTAWIFGADGNQAKIGNNFENFSPY